MADQFPVIQGNASATAESNATASSGAVAANSTDFDEWLAAEFGVPPPPRIDTEESSPMTLSESTNVSAVPSAAPSAFDSAAPSSSLGAAAEAAEVTTPPTSSPSSATPATPAPTYSALPIRAINILVLTDVHSWVMGHGDHDGAMGDVDYGHVLSFYQRLKENVDKATAGSGIPDLYLVDNGDFLHGTFLGDDPARFLPGILEKMPYDAVTLGDHDVADGNSLDVLGEPGGLFDEWGDRLVTSNVRVEVAVEDGQNRGLRQRMTKTHHHHVVSAGGSSHSTTATTLAPLGRNYKLLHGNQGTVLVLGFLYNMAEDEAVTTVEKVEDVLQQPWFTSLFVETTFDSVGNQVQTALNEFQFDVILVMAHMDAEDELIDLLHSKLRGYVGSTMTIHFVAGHTHRRAYRELDMYSTAFQAGRYLETIGYLSFDPALAASTEHVFIDADRASLAQSLGLPAAAEKVANEDTDESNNDYPSWMTRDGMELSQYVHRTMEHAGATQILGCSNSHYRADGGLKAADSLSRLYLERVLPASSYLRQAKRSGAHHSSHGNAKNEEGKPRHDAFVHSSLELSATTVRYDLCPGTVTVNDIYGVVPIDDAILKTGHTLRGDVILEIVHQMNNGTANGNVVGLAVPSGGGGDGDPASLPAYGIQNETMYTLHTSTRHAVTLRDAMVQLNVPAMISTSGNPNNQPTMRGLWMEFVQREWPYDGNQCQCLKEEHGCRSNGTDFAAFDYSVVTAPVPSGGGSGGGGGGGQDGGKGEFGAGTAAAPIHGGKTTHTSHHNGTPSNHSHHGQSKGGHHGSINKHRSNDTSNLPVFWITIAAVAMFFVIALRRPRRRASAGGTNDLELRETAAPGAYGVPGGAFTPPAMPNRGTYV